MLANEGAVYCPEELALLGRIFDGALESLSANMQTASSRATIARNILACATGGERDPVKLRLAALGQLQIAVAA